MMLWWICITCGVLWIGLSLRDFFRDLLPDDLIALVEWLSRVLIVVFAITSFLLVRADGYSRLYLWIITIVCGVGWEAWSFEAVRDVLAERLEGWLPHILAAAFSLLLVVGISPVAQQPPPCATPPCIFPTPAPTPPPSPSPCGLSLSGQIVQKNGGGAISGANIKVGQPEAISNADGSFQLPLCSSLGNNTLVRISHSDYMNTFLRLDDFTPGTPRKVELETKMRIIVLDAGEKSALQLAQDQQSGITSNLESQLECNEIEVFAEGNLKDQIIAKLHQYQEERALYDPKTLQSVGEFHGATHGVFYSMRRQGTLLQLESKLVSFKTSRIEKTANIIFERDSQLSDASIYLGNMLLSQLAEIKILSPKTGAKTNRLVNVEGFARFRPRIWTLWVTILPVNNPLHYPQQRVTPKEDGSWFASSVFLGEEKTVQRSQEFRVYVVFTDPERTAEIERYLHQLDSNPRSNTGLDLNAWNKSYCRVLDNIGLTRTDKEEEGPGQ